MNEILERIGSLIAENFYLGILLAFAAGVLTVFTPCSLSGIPLIVSYVSGTAGTKKKAFLYSLLICLGQTIAFVVMGLLAASLGRLMGVGGFGKVWNSILALLMIWMALEMFDITHVLSRGSSAMSKVTRTGALGAVLVGIVGAIFASPCSTPVLVAMLAYVSSQNMGLVLGGVLLLAYSLGHSVLLVIAGTSIGFVQNLASSERFSRVSVALKIVLGLLMLALAAYFIITTFYVA